MKVISEKRRAH